MEALCGCNTKRVFLKNGLTVKKSKYINQKVKARSICAYSLTKVYKVLLIMSAKLLPFCGIHIISSSFFTFCLCIYKKKQL